MGPAIVHDPVGHRPSRVVLARVASPYSSPVDDTQRQPKDGDRDPVSARITAAHDQGLIGAADRDIRLGNVRSAATMAELDMLSRELDQLGAALPASTIAAPGVPAERPWSRLDFGKARDESVGATDPTPGNLPLRSLVVSLAVVLALALAIGGFAVFLSSRGEESVAEGPAAAPGGQGDPSSEPSGSTSPGKPATPRSSYSLSAAGIRGFLQTYRKRFATTRVVDLTLYADYVIVQVPVPGKARQQGWIYRDKSGFTDFGGIRAVFPGAQVVDTRRLDVDALVRNIRRARNTLNVEKPAQAYVIIGYSRSAEQAPRVDVHLSNEFQESGYLATRLDGTVDRAFPFGA